MLFRSIKGYEFSKGRYVQFTPDELKALQEQIQRKVDGEEITEEPTEAPKTQIIDLMEALKASLAKGKGSTGGERKPAKRVERAAEVKPAKKRRVASA